MTTMLSTGMTPPGSAKTFFCVFCKDIAALVVGNLEVFRRHMISVHQVFYQFEILLAINFIDKEGKQKIIESVEDKTRGKRRELLSTLGGICHLI